MCRIAFGLHAIAIQQYLGGMAEQRANAERADMHALAHQFLLKALQITARRRANER